MNILFFGTPDYAVPFLQGLIQADMTPQAVFSQPDRPVGRKQTIEPTPIKTTARSYGVPVFQPEDIRTPEWIEKIKELSPDAIVVVAFGQIIPQEILDIPPKGCVNVHPSLLPRHRGASPLQETILQGDTTTAVTVMLMDAKMDHGPILAQKPVAVDKNETHESLREKTTVIGVPLLIDTLDKWFSGAIRHTPQDDSRATYTRLLSRETGKLDWSENRETIDRKIRGLNPWPGVWCDFNGKRLKIFASKKYEGTPKEQSSFYYSTNEGSHLFVACKDGLLELTDVQLEGKNRTSGSDFVQGYKKMLTQL